MIAGPDVTIITMRRAIAYTIAALGAAAEIDFDLDEDKKKALAAEKTPLEPFVAALREAERAIEDYDLSDGLALQARVVLGDGVLDRGVRVGNGKTKIALKSKGGLDATHVFGTQVSELTDAPLKIEPAKVIAAMGRMADLAEFPERAAIVADLEKRAHQQEALLGARDKGHLAENKLLSTARKRVIDASDALAKTKAALDGLFPRQRLYVATFFLDTSHGHTRRTSAPSETHGGAGVSAPK